MSNKNSQSVTSNLERSMISSLLISSFSSVTSLIFSHPFEIVKCRMQVLQKDQKIYGSLFGALYKIYREEGFSGLYQGLTPAMLVQFVLNGIRLGTYPIFKKQLNAEPDKKYYYSKTILASSIAGVLSVVIAAPTFLLKIKIGQKNQSLFEIIRSIYKEQGILGLWKGTNAQILRMISGGTAQLVAFEQATQFCKKSMPNVPLKFRSLLASTYAALMFSLIVHPLDLVVSNVSQMSQVKSCRVNPLVNLKYQIKYEGFLSIYKGFNAACFRNIPYTVFSLLFWEYYSTLAQKYGY